MRRLPIHLLLDVSESMVGEPIKAMEAGITELLGALRQDPMALESVYLAVHGFAGKARTLVPLIDLINFRPIPLPLGGGTSLGAGLDLLMDDLERTTVPTTAEAKGDWRPMVILLTDGAPTDNPTAAITRWKSDFTPKGINLIAFSVGDQADLRVLKQLTEHVLILKDADPNSIASLFKWVSSSISTQSERIGENKDKFNLEKLDKNVMEESPAEGGGSTVDDRFAILLGKCCATGGLYLLKYADMKRTGTYQLEGGYPVSKRYDEFTSTGFSPTSVATDKLIGAPFCPLCEAREPRCMCSCGKLFCSNQPSGQLTCPWCGKTSHYAPANFDVDRAQG
jgi:uncharacterized protein YegL